MFNSPYTPNPEVVKLLISHGADLTARMNFDPYRTALAETRELIRIHSKAADPKDANLLLTLQQNERLLQNAGVPP